MPEVCFPYWMEIHGDTKRSDSAEILRPDAGFCDARTAPNGGERGLETSHVMSLPVPAMYSVNSKDMWQNLLQYSTMNSPLFVPIFYSM